MPDNPELGQPGLPGDCMTSCDANVCNNAVFTRLTVDYLVAGGGRVAWELDPSFVAEVPGPYEFQLQHGRTGNPDATDWEPVGANAFDTYFMIDDKQRLFGKTNWTHYRICLRTSDLTTYISQPVHALSGLDRRDWRMIKEIYRKERLRMRLGVQEGYLLKRKVYGEYCSCLDHQTGEVTNPECELCYGTKFVGGYFPPMPCIYADLKPVASHEELDGGQGRGSINDVVTMARMLMPPQLGEEDIWVARRSDQRWYVHRIQNTAEMKGVPVTADVELRRAAYKDPIYTITIPGQVIGT